MDQGGGLPDGAVHGLMAFCFSVFLVTVALWPQGPADMMPGTPADPTDPGDAGTGSSSQSYDGPVTAAEVQAHCQDATPGSRIACYRVALPELLRAKGPVHAFDVLEQLNTLDDAVSGQGHSIAHDLGRAALDHYGSIEVALQECSYKMFQGCLHGALESYLQPLPTIERHHLAGLCDVDDATKRSLCVHGIGHGILLSTNYQVNRSLEICDLLDSTDKQTSCYSGVIMENLVGWSQSTREGHHHHHPSGEEPGYMVRKEGDDYYPCSVLASRYQPECWKQQVDYILYMNGGDFRDAAAKCDAAPPQYVLTCYSSMGRDASGWYRNVTLTVEYCSYGNAERRAACIRGMADETVLHYYDPTPAIADCWKVPAVDKDPCYTTVGSRGNTFPEHRGRMGEVCALAEPEHIDTCRRGAGLGPAAAEASTTSAAP